MSIYSDQKYTSYDLDFITQENSGKVRKTLLELGFEYKGKYFVHPDCIFFIEFVSPPVAIGQELIDKYSSLETAFGKLLLLTPTDCVKDRVASFFCWQDKQAFEQALMVAQHPDVDLKEIKDGQSQKIIWINFVNLFCVQKEKILPLKMTKICNLVVAL